MGQVKVFAIRFHKKEQLDLYQKTGEETGAFMFPKPIATVTTEDKCIKPLLAVLAEGELRGTILKAYRKNDDGFWDYCAELAGRQKGEFGLEETAESKAASAQKGEELEEEAGEAA